VSSSGNGTGLSKKRNKLLKLKINPEDSSRVAEPTDQAESRLEQAVNKFPGLARYLQPSSLPVGV